MARLTEPAPCVPIRRLLNTKVRGAPMMLSTSPAPCSRACVACKALITRREFVQQTAFAAAALCGCPVEVFDEAQRMPETREQNAAPFDSTAIRKLASKITGHVITPDSSA